MDGIQTESLLYWKQSCAQKATNESAVKGKIGSLRHIHPAEAPAWLLWACHYFKDPDYRFICSSSSTEGHLFKWSVTLVNVLSKQHTSLHCNCCFGVANGAVNIIIMMLMPQLYELKKNLFGKYYYFIHVFWLKWYFSRRNSPWRIYLVIFCYSMEFYWKFLKMQIGQVCLDHPMSVLCW